MRHFKIKGEKGYFIGTHMGVINKDGSEARIKRAILFTQVPQYLQGMDFDPKPSLASVQ